MKRIKRMFLSVGLAAMMGLSVACGSKDITTAPSEMTQGVITNSGVEFPEMMDVAADKAGYYYNVETEWYSDFSAKISGAPEEADEVIVFKASSNDTVDDIEAALNQRIESRKNDFESYAPEQFDKLSGSSVEVDGLYVSLLVTNDNSSAKKTYNEYFK